jgi:hypothetical protein
MLNEYPEYYPTSGETIMENCYYFGMELIEEIGKRFVYGDAWGPDGGSLTYNSETDRWIMKIGFYTVSIHISRTAILDESIDIPNDLMRYCVSINMVGEMDAKDCHVQDNQNVAIYNRVAKFHQCLQEEIRGASPVSEPTLRKGLDMTVAFIPAEKPPLLFGNPRRPPRVRPIKLFTKPRPRPRRMEAQLIKLFENMHI